MKNAIVIACILLSGCYTTPKGSAKCNAVYEATYIKHQVSDGNMWAILYADKAFEACMK